MSERCKEEVWHDFHISNCSRNATKDGYCKQHHPESIKARKEKRLAEFKASLLKETPYTIAINRAEKAEQQRDALLNALINISTLTEDVRLKLISEIESPSKEIA